MDEGAGSNPGHTTRACQLLAASRDSQTSSLGELAVGNPGRPPQRCIACSRSRAVSSKAAAVTGTVRASRLTQTSRQTKKQTSNQTNKQSKKQTNKQANKQTISQPNKQAPTNTATSGRGPEPREMGLDLNCASCGCGPEPRDGASILNVHLVVVARSARKGRRS